MFQDDSRRPSRMQLHIRDLQLQIRDLQLQIGNLRISGVAPSMRPGTTLRCYVAIGVGMVRNARVTCQNNCRLIASATEWAVPGRMMNWRSPFGSLL
ncbi:hypothetical protein V1283_000416 [Bradyrhizobium sp. AZCC 2262]